MTNGSHTKRNQLPMLIKKKKNLIFGDKINGENKMSCRAY